MIGPIALVAFALLLIVVLDATKGGAATPAKPIGEIGTPVRNAYVAPTATPIGQVATPKPKPTFSAAAAKGNPDERDAKRRTDILVLLDAANRLKAKDGAYPATNNNVQTLCAYKDLDIGCKLKDTFGADLPSDPLGDPVKNGYWYSSDGQTVKVYTALEGDIGDELKCPTTDVELKKKSNLICVKGP